MKRFIILISALLCLAVFASCEEEPEVCAHEFGEWNTTREATCLEEGIRSRECSLCTYREREYTALGEHNPETVPGTPSTCSVPGLSDGSECSLCGETLKERQELELAPHTEFILNGYDPKCYMEGLTEGKQCSVCNAITVKQVPIPMTEHMEVEVPASEPSCFRGGNTAGTKCNVCGTIFSGCEQLPRLEHVAVTVPGTPATCGSYGLTESTACSLCNYVIERPRATYLVGEHSYSGGVCTVCGELENAHRDLRLEDTNNNNENYYAVFGLGSCKDTDVIIPRTHKDRLVYTIITDVFKGNTKVTSVYIPSSVENLGKEVFRGCASLTTIRYGGTMQEWQRLFKGSDWNRGSAICEIICSDGTIPVSSSK